MDSLAQLLCEAVENEDAKEVENLLNIGANPNHVLPNGIAAIHLASGKESESALRCLSLILQQGGDPNVRSIELLTPVHVAASWGCYKALVFLLRRGGDPTLQDQEGNTASDLALVEGNRRCVVTLQEYEMSTESAWLEQNGGYCKTDTSLPNDITQMSNISLLLESSSVSFPFSSTKIFPFAPIPRNECLEKCMDDAVIASQIDLPDLGEERESIIKRRHEIGTGIDRAVDTAIHTSAKPETTHSDSSGYSLADSLVLSSTRLSHANNCIANSSITLKTDVLSEDILSSDKEVNGCILTSSVDHLSHSCGASTNKGRKSITFNEFCRNNKKSDMRSHLNSNGEAILGSVTTRTLMDSQSILEGGECLDVTSPDHVYVYSRGPVPNDEDLEKTLVMPNINEHVNSEEEDVSSNSKYNSCESDCYASLGESCNFGETRSYTRGSAHHLYKDNSVKVYNQNNSGEESSPQTQSCHLSSPKSVKTIPIMEANNTLTIEKREPSGVYRELVNNSKKAKDQEYVVSLLQSQSQMIDNEYQGTRVSEEQNGSESPTLYEDGAGDDGHGSGSQNLKDHLRHLMLCAKNYRPVSQTKPVSEQNQVINKKLQANPSCSTATSATLVAEPSVEVVEEKGDADLSAELRKMMMSTKTFQSPSTLDKVKSPCFFTPRTKSRLLSSSSRSSSSSLFDDTVEMPQRGRRIRSPGRVSQSPLSSNTGGSRRTLFSIGVASEETNNSDTCPVELKEPKLSHIKVACSSALRRDSSTEFKEPETTGDLTNFLTDDLTSSDTELPKNEPLCHKVAGSHGVDGMVSGNTWLTEDGEDESSGEAGHGETIVGPSSLQQKTHSVPPFNGSVLHSTWIDDAEKKDNIETRVPRYSFSRLSCVLKPDEGGANSCQLNTVCESYNQAVPLSPGGRPVNVSQVEPVEYLYMDNERGHTLIEKHVPYRGESTTDFTENSEDTIIYDWREYKSNQQKMIQVPKVLPSNKVALELYRLSNDDIASKLRELGDEPGPVNSQTRKMYIALLDKRLKESLAKGKHIITGYSPELSLAFRTFQIPDCNTDETTLYRDFDQPDKTQKWREGVLKSSFNYLLLDPRVTRNLPSRCNTLSQPDCFRTFVSSVFYVGKGKRSRPYSHLYEALTHYKARSKQVCPKVQHILDIWSSGLGVISLHCFQNTIPVEAYTREACMVDAIGLKMLTNQKKGVYYGQAKSWSPNRQRLLGVHMLNRALQIFLAEGERQLRPPDIRSGS
ncbi:ankyrin repeat and LEM domain-containing protein 1 [Rhinophrynus dorsalis]